MARNKYDVDEIYEEHFDLGQLKRLGRYVLPYKKDMIIAAVLMLSSSAATMLIPRFFMTVMNDMIPNKDVQGLVRISLLTLLVILYSVFALKIKIKITNRVGQTVIHELRNDIFWHLQELPFSYYDDRPHGKIQVRVVNYVNNLSDLLSNGLLNTITDLCSLIFIIFFMLSINVKLTLMCMCGLPVLALFAVVIKKRQHRAWQIQSNKQSNLNAYIAESINGIRVTQSFVREQGKQRYFQPSERRLPPGMDEGRALQLHDGTHRGRDLRRDHRLPVCCHCGYGDERRRGLRGRTGGIHRIHQPVLVPHHHPGEFLQFAAHRHLLSGAYF